MPFDDLSTFFDPDIHLPYRGKTYRIPGVSAHEGLRLRQIFDAVGGMSMEQAQSEAMKILGATWTIRTEQVPVVEDGQLVTRDVEVAEWTGGVFQEMAEDGMTFEAILHAGLTVVHQVLNGQEAAERYWKTALTNKGGDAPGKARSPRKATTKGRSSSRASTSKRATTGGRKRTATTTPAAETSIP